MDSELLRLALMSSDSAMLETAEHFEDKEDWDKAALLYHKVQLECDKSIKCPQELSQQHLLPLITGTRNRLGTQIMPMLMFRNWRRGNIVN